MPRPARMVPVRSIRTAASRVSMASDTTRPACRVRASTRPSDAHRCDVLAGMGPAGPGERPQIARNRALLPPRLARITPRMAAQDWLASYRDLAYLGAVLDGIATRSPRIRSIRLLSVGRTIKGVKDHRGLPERDVVRRTVFPLQGLHIDEEGPFCASKITIQERLPGFHEVRLDHQPVGPTLVGQLLRPVTAVPLSVHHRAGQHLV